MRQLSLPGIQKSSEQIVSKMLTKFLILDAGWLLADGTCVEEDGVHGEYSLGWCECRYAGFEWRPGVVVALLF